MVSKLPWGKTLWKGHFSDFCKFLSDKVETIFLECNTKGLRTCFISKLVIRNFLENCLQVTLRLNTNHLVLWKKHVSIFCQFLECRRWIYFGKARESFEDHLNHQLKLPWAQKRMSDPLKIVFFSFLQSFELKLFSGKVRQNIQNI